MKTFAETLEETKTDFYERARVELIHGLALLAPENHRIFKLGYAGKDGKRATAEDMAKSIADVVRDMPDEKLDWAVQQVQRTLDKKGEN